MEEWKHGEKKFRVPKYKSLCDITGNKSKAYKRIRYFMRVKAQAIARELHTLDWEPIYQQIQNRVFEFFHIQALEQLPNIKYADVLYWIDEQLFGLHNEFGKAVCSWYLTFQGASTNRFPTCAQCIQTHCLSKWKIEPKKRHTEKGHSCVLFLLL